MKTPLSSDPQSRPRFERGAFQFLVGPIDQLLSLFTAMTTVLMPTVKRLSTAHTLLGVVLLALTGVAQAGTWSHTAWTGDSTSNISSARTAWAQHYGSTSAATVNGVTVTGVSGPTISTSQVDVTGPNNFFTGDTNSLTSLGGTGSGLIGATFLYSVPPVTHNVTLKSLTSGHRYTVSFLSVGFDAPGARTVAFTAGSDTLNVDQGFYGNNNGIRVDYTFTASGTTQAISIAPTGIGSFHIYGIALNASDRLIASDTLGASFAAAGNWNTAAAPASGNNYVTGAFTLKTATGSGNQTFAGDSLTIDSGGSLSIQGSGTITANNLSLNGGSITNGLGSGVATLQGTGMTVAANSTLDGGGSGKTLLIQSAMGGSAGLTIQSSGSTGGVVQFTAANTYTGATAISTGATLNLSGAGNANNSDITLAGTGNLTFTATDGRSFTKAITGSGGNVSFNVAGNTSDSGGGDATSFGMSNTGAFTGTVVVNTGLVSASSNAAFGNTANVIQLNAASGQSAGLMGNGLTLASTRAIQLTQAGGNSVFRAFGGSNFQIDGQISGAGNLVKTDGGTLILTSANTYTGTTRVGGGVLQINNALALQNSTLNTSGSGVVTLSSVTTPTLGGLSGSTNLASAITTGYSGVTSLTLNPGTGVSNTYSGVVANGAAGMSLVKTGAGTQVLTGANTFTGNVTVSAGTLEIGGTGSILQSSNASTVSVASGATVLLSGSADNVLGWGGSGVTGAYEQWVVAGTINSTGGRAQTLPFGGVTLNGGTLNSTTDNATYGVFYANDSGLVTANGTGNTISGASVGINGTSVTKTFAVSTPLAGDALTISAVVKDVAAAGSFSKAGAGTVTMTGANTFTGATTISAGTLQIGNGSTTGSLSTSSAITNNGTLSFNRSNTITQGTNFNSVISGSGAVTQAGSGTLVLTGTNTYTGATTINSGGTLQIGAGSTTGALSTSSAITNNGTLSFNRSNTITQGTNFANVISGSGAVTQAGSGTLVLNGTNTYTGTTTVSSGVLNIQNASALGTTAAGTSVTSGAALEIGNGITTAAEALTLNGTGISSGGALRSVGGHNTYAGLVTLGSAARINTDVHSLTLSHTGTITGSGFGLTVGGASSTTIASIIGTGTGTLTKDGVGTLTLSGASTFSGGTTISAGTIALGADSTPTSGTVTSGPLGTGALTLSGGTLSNGGSTRTLANAIVATAATTSSLRANSGGNLKLTGNITGSGTLWGYGTSSSAAMELSGDNSGFTGTYINNSTGPTFFTSPSAASASASWDAFTGTGFQVLSSGTYNFGSLSTSGGGSGIVLGAATGVTATYSVGARNSNDGFGGVIADNFTGVTGAGSGSFVKVGSGFYTLYGANTYTGTTTVSAGTLTIGDGGTNGSLSSSSGIITNAALVFDRSNTITQGTDFGTSISGTGTLTKQGAGTLVLNGDNSYAGLTTVGTGALNIQHANALGTTAGATSITSGAALQIQGGITTAAEALTLRGTGISTTGALRNISGNNNYAGLVTLASASRINSDSGTLTLSHTGTITGFGIGLTVGGAGDTTIASIIGTDSGTLTKDGAGTLTLSGASTYTGATTVSAGVVNIQNASALGTNAAGTSVASGAALQIQGSITTAAEDLTLNGTGVSSDGALRNISGTNTYAGLVTLGSASRINSDSGTLTLSNSGTITGSGLGLTVGGAGNTTINSIIGTGSGTLTKDGAGTLTLAGANTYTGTTTISAGTVALSGGGRLADTTAVNLSGATGTLDISAINTTVEAIGSLAGVASSSVVLGTKNFQVGNANDTSFAGAISGTGGLIKVGAGKLTLSGANTYNGSQATQVRVGTLEVATGGSISHSSSSLLVGFSGNSGTLNISGGSVSNGSGTLGGDTNSTGTANVSAGTWTNSGNLSVGVNGTGVVNLTGGTVHVGVVAGTGTVTLGSSGTLNLGTGGTVGTLNAATVTSSSGTAVVNFNHTGSLTFAPSLTGSLVMNKLGTGTTILTGTNTYTGATTVSAGILNLQNATGLGTTAGSTSVSNGATLQLQGGITVGAEALSLNGGSASGQTGALVNVSGTNTYGGAVTVAASSSISAASGSVLNLTGGVVKDGTVATFNGGGTINVNTVAISGSSANSDLVIDGTTVNLGVANTYNGPTFIRNTGTLNANVAGALPTATRTAVTFDGTGTSVLSLGAAQSVASLTAASAATVTLGANTLTVGTSTGSTTFAGIIGGTGGLTKDGASTQVLTGTNTFTGNVTVSAGTLEIGGTGSILNSANASTVTIASGATALLSSTVSNALGYGHGSAEQWVVAGTVNSTGGAAQALPYGGVTLNGGTLTGVAGAGGQAPYGTFYANGLQGAITANGTGNTISAANVGIQSGGTLTLSTPQSADTLTASAVFMDAFGAGALTKTGAGTLTLSGASTYTGATTLSAGTLSVTGSIASSSLTTINGGTLMGTGTVGAIQLNSAGAVNLGTGTLSTGNIAITDGQLVFNVGSTSSYGSLSTTGAVNLTNGGSGAQLVLNAINGYTAQVGDTFTLITNDLTEAISGNFAGLTEGQRISNVLGSSLSGQITYVGGTGNDVVLMVVSPPPTVTSVTPSSGSTAGGTSVTITGTNLTGATGVTIGGAAATSVVVTNATTITCTTPAGSAGTGSVVVTTAGGSNAANTLYTYILPSLVSWYRAEGTPTDALGANPGTAQGGVTYAAGKVGQAFNFDGGNSTAVICGNNPSLQLSNGTISAWIKTSNAGSSYRGIVVKQLAYGLFMLDNVLMVYDWAGGGNRSTGVSLNDNQWHHVAFTFQSGVSNGSKIYIDGALSTAFTWNVSGQGSALAVGSGFGTGLSQNFTGLVDEARVYSSALSATDIQNSFISDGGTLSAPTVTAISPTSGSTAGGTSVTLTGTNFTGATGVTIGGAAATGVSVVSASSITCTTPAGTAGTASVVVTTAGGSNAANTLFTYNSAPTDIALSSSSIAENNAANATVGTLSTTDADVSDTFTYTLVSGTGSTDNASFTIAGSSLRLTPSANFEVKNSYALRVRSTDAGGAFFEKEFTVTVTNVIEAPVIASATTANLAPTTATLGGNVTSDGGLAVTERGVVYALTATNSNPQIGGTGVTKVAGTGTTGVFTFDVSGLSASTAYSYAAYVTNADATSYTSAGTFTTTATFVPGTGVTVTYSAVIGGTTPVAITGGGTLALTAPNTYTAPTNVQAGTVSINTVGTGSNAQSLGAGNVVNLGVASTSSGRLVYTGGAGTLDKTINALGNGGDTIQNSGTGLLTLSGTINKTGTTLTLQGGANPITVSGTITGNTGSPNSDLIVDGGLVTLASANTYNGPTYIINGATLSVNVVDALPTNPARSAILMDQSGSGDSILNLGASQAVLSLTGADTSGIALNEHTLTIGTTSGSTTFTGGIIGSGGLTKDGASTQILSLKGLNNYTGATTVSAGTLTLDNVAGYKTTALSAASGATLSILMPGNATSSWAAVFDPSANAFNSVNAAITGAGLVTLGTTGGPHVVAGGGSGTMTTNMSAGGMLDVQSGEWAWGWARGSAATNNGSLNVASGAAYRSSDVAFQFDSLTGSGTIGNAFNASAVTLTLGVQGTTNNATYGVSSNTATFSGVIASGELYNNVTTSALNLVKTGSGTQILSGANTYTGTTTISGGTLQIGAGSTTGSLSTSSSITNNATLAFNRSNTITQGTDFASLISGSGAVTQAGTGTLVLSGTNTYTGATTINSGGTLQIGAGGTTGALSTSSAITNNGTLAFNRSNTLTQGTDFASVISGSGAVTYAGSGTLVLNGANTYSGTTTVSGGTLNLSGAGNSNNSDIVMSGGSNLVFTATDSRDFSKAITGTAGTLTFNVAGNTSDSGASNGTNFALGNTGSFTGTIVVNTGLVSFGSNTAFGNTANVIQLNAASGQSAGLLVGGNAILPSTRAIQLTTAGGNSIFRAFLGATLQIDGVISGAGNLVKTDGGNVLLTGVNTFTGSTRVGGGELQINNALALQNSTFDTTGSSLLRLTGVTTPTFGGLSGSTNLASKIAGYTLGVTSLTINPGTGVSNTYSGVVANGAAGMSLVKTGAGTQIFSGANTYTGTTTVSEGTLSITGSINSSAAIAVNAGLLSTSGADKLANTAAVTVAGGTLTVGGADTVDTLTMSSGTIGGSSTLTATTYGLSGGTVNGNLGTGTINSSGTVALNGTAAATAVNVTAGTLTLGASSALNSATTLGISGGSLVLGNSNQIGNATVTVSGGTLAMGGNSDSVNIFNLSSGSITGSGTLTATTYGLSGGTVNSNLGTGTINSSGTVALNGTAGATAVNVTAGTMTLGASASLNSAATLIMSGGGLTLGASNQISDSTAVGISNFASVLSLGAFSETVGSITLSAANATNLVTGTGTLTATTYHITGSSSSSGQDPLFASTLSLGTGTLNSSGTWSLLSTSAASAVNVSSGFMRLGGSNLLSDSATVTVTAGVISLGSQTDTVGTFNMSGGFFGSGSGKLTAATYNLTGGTLAGNLGAGSATVSTGTVTYSSGGSLDDTSTLTVSSGTLALTTFSDTVAAVTLTGGNITSTTGVLTSSSAYDMQAGSVSAILGGTVGLTKTTAGTVTLTGVNTFSGKTVVGAGTVSISSISATAGANQSLGTNVAVDLGVAATSSGTLVYTGAAGTLAKNINAVGNGSDTVQNSGSGLLTLSGTLTKSGTVLTLKGGSNGITVSGVIAGNTGSPNSDLVIDGGTVTLTNANTYNGPTFIRNSGTLNANVTNALPTANGRTAVTFDGTGTSVLTLGADQSVASLTAAGAATVTLNANTLTVGTSSGSTTFAGGIGGTGGLIKDGASTLILSGTNGYTGATTLSAGNLIISGSIGSSTLTTINGGTLLGTGTVGAIQLNSGGVLTPGGASTAGTLSTGNLAIVDGQLVFNLGGTSSHSQLNTTGSINLTAGGSGAKLVLNAISGYAATLGDSFTLVSNNLTNTISGAFAKGTFGGTKVVTLTGVDYVEGLLGSGYYGRIAYNSGAGKDLVLKVVTPVMTVTQSGTGVTAGGTYSFGSVDKLVPAVPLTKTFTIQNTGEVDLMGIVVNAPTGAAASDYSIDLTGTASTLPPGSSTTFTVTFNPSRVGTRAAAIAIDSNALTNNPFNIILTGVGSIARDVTDGWTVAYAGPDAPGTLRNGMTKAVAVQKSTTSDTAVAVFATGYTSSASGGQDIYTAKYHPVTGALLWAKTFNGAANLNDQGAAIAVDSSGNVVITGYTTKTATDADVYVAKYASADGTLLWQKTYAGAGNGLDAGVSVAVDASDNVAVAGYGFGATGGMDFFAARYSSDGSTTYFERLIDGGSNRTDSASSVAVNSAGDLAVAGYIRNAANNMDFKVMKLDATAGTTLWQYTFNGSSNTDDGAYAVAFNAADEVIATGYARAFNYDLYTVKLSGSGVLVWQRQWNGPFDSSDTAYQLAIDSNSDVIVGGTSYRAASVQDGYVVKYSGVDGSIVWDRRFNGPAGLQDLITSVAIDKLNNVVATGYSQNAAGNYDVLTAKMLADDGGLMWEQRYDGIAGRDDSGTSVAISPDGNVFVAGYATQAAGTTDFLVKNYQSNTATVQAAQTITFANPGAQNANVPLTLVASADSGLTVRFTVVSGSATFDSSGNTLLNFTGSGSVTVRATQSGSAVYAAATPVEQTFTVGKVAQTISFVLPATLNSSAQWPLTGVASSGLAVTYNVQSGPGSITDGVLSFSGAGDVTVRASQAGDGRFNAASNVDAVVTSQNRTPVVIFDNIAENWRDTYAGSGAGVGNDIALQLSGNNAVAGFVAGYTTTSSTGKDLYLVKYLADGTLVWSVASGTSGDDEAMSVVVDGNGDVVVAGYVTGTGRDLYVAKYNGTTGSKIWDYTYSGTGSGNDVGVSLALDGTTNVVVGGYAVGSGTSNDFFAAKLNLTTGALVWASVRNRTGATSDVPAKVAVGTDGSVALAGATNSDAWTIKLAAADGTLVWQVVYNFLNRPDAVRGLGLDAANNVIIAAFSQGSNYDIYTAKYSSLNGTLIWGKRYNSSFNSSDHPWDLAVDEDSNVYVTGASFRAASVRDGMTLKYAGLDGTLLWEGRYNGTSSANDENFTISLDGIGNPVISGYTTNSDGTTDVYLAKHNKVPGTIRWQRTFDGANNKNDSIQKVKVDPNGNVWMAGSATGTDGKSVILVLRNMPTP